MKKFWNHIDKPLWPPSSTLPGLSPYHSGFVNGDTAVFLYIR